MWSETDLLPEEQQESLYQVLGVSILVSQLPFRSYRFAPFRLWPLLGFFLLASCILNLTLPPRRPRLKKLSKLGRSKRCSTTLTGIQTEMSRLKINSKLFSMPMKFSGTQSCERNTIKNYCIDYT